MRQYAFTVTRCAQVLRGFPRIIFRLMCRRLPISLCSVGPHLCLPHDIDYTRPRILVLFLITRRRVRPLVPRMGVYRLSTFLGVRCLSRCESAKWQGDPGDKQAFHRVQAPMNALTYLGQRLFFGRLSLRFLVERSTKSPALNSIGWRRAS